MYSLSALRRQLDALRRKLAPQLAVVRLRKPAEDLCLQWDKAVADRKPLPEPNIFVRQIAQAGFRLNTFMALHNYLERCRQENRRPQPRNVIIALLPNAAANGICDAILRWDRPAR